MMPVSEPFFKTRYSAWNSKSLYNRADRNHPGPPSLTITPSWTEYRSVCAGDQPLRLLPSKRLVNRGSSAPDSHHAVPVTINAGPSTASLGRIDGPPQSRGSMADAPDRTQRVASTLRALAT